MIPPQISFWTLLDCANYLEMVEKLAATGDFVKLPTASATYLVNHPDYVREILQTRYAAFPKGGHSLKRLTEALGQGLQTNEGEAWQRTKQAFHPYFLEKNTRPHLSTIRTITQQHMDLWETRYLKKNKPFNFSRACMGLVLSITTKILFSLELSEIQRDELLTLVEYGNRYCATTTSVAPWWPSFRNVKYRFAKHRFEQALSQLIHQHDIARATRENNDLLDAAARLQYHEQGPPLTAKELLDEFKTLLVTGHETTGSGLLWTWICLSRYPAYRESLRAEATRVFQQPITTLSLQDFPQTRAVFEESLRLYPPIWLLAERVCDTEQSIGPYTVPPYAALMISPYTLHRHLDFWEKPLTFMPERFYAENTPSRHKLAYLPFGAGPRLCIASQFAMIQAVLILATIAEQLDVEIVNVDDIQPEPLISLRPNPAVMARIRRIS